ncbi:hypothetical protein J4E85_001939 [Alternaria conjuncta]|uniref:uncharacterized protein n=1 Tax=Alternaria conjuncta TaxID=181017 RepID=UPI00221E6002|nr:uncharacterized protein J4E85_001939 [Alternaria conjuncta]KAI4936606.1 hypothetical protein J4E85_001939 [Alternaria conjuncta]
MLRLRLYLITYPPTLPKKGFIPNEERCVGVTSHAYINTYVKAIATNSAFIGWKAETIECDPEDPIIKRYIEKDGGKVKIVGDEWKPNGDDAWATAGLFELGYRKESEQLDISSYTNQYFIAQDIDALKDKPKRFWYIQVLFLMNEDDLEDYKKLDGGCEPFREEIADGRNGHGGWIAKGIQEEYARVVLGKVPREKAIKEKDEVELSNGIMSMGISDKAACSRVW